jgi:cholesterol transport system auxiliary component
VSAVGRGTPRAVRAAIGAVAAAVLLVVGGGCSVVKPPARPAWHVFALEPEAETEAAAATVDADADAPVAVIAVPGAAAGYATRRMAYTHGGGELEYFATHRWADAPARMLAPLLHDALMRTGAFRAVAVAPTRAAGGLVVETQLLAFRQELDGPQPRFRAVLRVTLVRPDAPSSTDSRVFEAAEPMDAPGPEPGVRAADRATARLLAEVAAYCAESREVTPP